MRPVRLSLVMLPIVLGATLTACSVRTETTERAVYAPVPARTVVYPSTAYYYPSYYPSTSYYYREPYHPAYYSSY